MRRTEGKRRSRQRNPPPDPRGTRKARAAALLSDPERSALLGTASDEALAARWGEEWRVVRLARYEVGVFFAARARTRPATVRPSHHGKRARIREDAEKMALLGTRRDSDLARLWGVSHATVTKLREEEGIPRYRPRRERPPKERPRGPRDLLAGDEARIARLGTVPDIVLAEEWGIAHTTVYYARVRRGIPPCRRRPRPAPDPALIAALGKERDIDLAARFGLSAAKIAALRVELGIRPAPREEPAWSGDLGELSDFAVAKKWGVPRTTVASYRRRRGIPPAFPPRERRPRPPVEAPPRPPRGRGSSRSRGRRPHPLSEFAERAYQMREADPRLSWTEIAASLGLRGGPEAGMRLYKAVGTYARRRGLAWPLAHVR